MKTIVLMGLAFVGGMAILFYVGQENRKRKDDIEQNGIDGTATVINRTRYSEKWSRRYNIYYDFMHEGKIVRGSFNTGNKWYYTNAIIGMKYKLRYLPDAPENRSIIYIEAPIYSEYDNIMKERERILKDYPFSQKKMRPLEEIQDLIPR